MIELSLDQMRNLILDVQGLRTTRPSKSVLAVARRIHNIQVDTISVVSRSHNLITYNRFPNYREGDVWKAEKEGKLFEYWSHAMCLLPMDSYPYYRWKMDRMREVKSSWYVNWGRANTDVVEAVFSKVKKDGPTMSKELGSKKKQREGWWDWKKEKRALEYLMNIGRLMVKSRENFQKSYDLPERVIPSGVDTQPMDVDEIPLYVTDVVFKSLGIGDYRDLKFYTGSLVAKYLWKSKRSVMEEYLDSLVGDLLEEISFGQKGKYYIYKKYSKSLPKEKSDSDEQPVKFLTPFDNILRERHYPLTIWDFDYKIECYMPKEKRKYGYFVLPILDQNELRGRIDAKVHRKTATLEVISLYIEDEALKTDDGLTRLMEGMKHFAKFHQCEKVVCGKVFPRKLSSKVRQLVEGLDI